MDLQLVHEKNLCWVIVYRLLILVSLMPNPLGTAVNRTQYPMASWDMHRSRPPCSTSNLYERNRLSIYLWLVHELVTNSTSRIVPSANKKVPVLRKYPCIRNVSYSRNYTVVQLSHLPRYLMLKSIFQCQTLPIVSESQPHTNTVSA